MSLGRVFGYGGKSLAEVEGKRFPVRFPPPIRFARPHVTAQQGLPAHVCSPHTCAPRTRVQLWMTS